LKNLRNKKKINEEPDALPKKRKRGRPRKHPIQNVDNIDVDSPRPKRKRGRPRKSDQSSNDSEASPSSLRRSSRISSPSGRKERCKWTIDENKKLLQILSSGKTNVDEIYEELSKSWNNTKTYEEVKNKRMNLLARVTNTKSIIAVLSEDIGKQEGAVVRNSLAKSPGKKVKRGPGRPRKYPKVSSIPSSPPSNSPQKIENSPPVKRSRGRPRKYPKPGSTTQITSEKNTEPQSPPQQLVQTVTGPINAETVSALFAELKTMLLEQKRLIMELRKDFQELKETELTSIEDDSMTM